MTGSVGRKVRHLPALRPILGSAVLFVLIEWVTRLNLVPVTYLPHASTVVARIADLLVDRAFLDNLTATVLIWFICLLISMLLSVPLGVALGSSETLFKITSPVVNLMRPIPSVCLLPLVMLLWGTGPTMKIILVTYAMSWPILFNTIYGIHDLDHVAVETARCFGLGPLAVLWRVGLPSASPLIFVGVRISASIGLIVLVSSELLSDAQTGIGAYIMRVSSAGGNLDIVYAAAAITGLLGLCINFAFLALDRWKFAWRFFGNSPA